MDASFAVWIFAALTLRSVVASAYVIPSGSMIPTLQVGDRVFVEKLSLGLNVPLSDAKLGARSPTRGDIVVFAQPVTGIDLIKRVVAVAGDRVELVGGQLRINGVPVQRRPMGTAQHFDWDDTNQRWYKQSYDSWQEAADAASFTTLSLPLVRHGSDFGPVVVPAGGVFVLGDNRDNSNDSRFWGFVPLQNIRGRARGVLWSSGPDGPRWSRFFQRLH
jgi:signal peptidase I